VLEDGRDGLKLLLRRLLVWRVGVGYWLFALAFIVPVFILGSLFNPLFKGDTFSFEDLKLGFEIVPMFIAFFIISGLGQELGWTGYLTPRLQARYSALTASIIRAVFAGLWHLPLYLYSRQQPPALADFPYGGWIAAKGFLVAFGTMFVLFQIPWSIFHTWIFNNTGGSLLLVAVTHASEIWVAYLMLSAGIDPSNLDNYWGYGGLLFAVAIIIVIMTGPQNLSRKRKRIVHHPKLG